MRWIKTTKHNVTWDLNPVKKERITIFGSTSYLYKSKNPCLKGINSRILTNLFVRYNPDIFMIC